MGIIAWLIFLGLATLVGLGVTISSKRLKGVGAGVAAAAVVSLILTFFIGGMQSVPVKSIGVGQALGTVNGQVYGPGLHESWQPWESTTDIDETVQTTTYEDTGNDQGSACNGGLAVRIGGQQTACADVTIQWQIKPSAASSLYQDYANQGNLMNTVTDAVVIRELKATVNTVMGDYNPITDVSSVTGTNTASSQFSAFGPTILKDMQADIGSRVTVLNVLLPHVYFDSAIEGQLSSIQQSYANFAIATENENVNTAKATAYKDLGTPTLAQLVAQCITEAGSNAGQCIPGSVSKIALSGAPTGG